MTVITRFNSLVSGRLATAALLALMAVASGPLRAAALDAETPDYLVPDGPGATINTARNADGRLDIQIRGERFDARRLIKRVLADVTGAQSGPAGRDFDLHIAVATLDGLNGEALHGVDMRLARRAGRIDDFALTASIANSAAVGGGVRVRPDKSRVLHLEADDAGALLRFVDLGGKLARGTMWLALDFPSMREGVLNIRDFDLPLAAWLAPLRDALAPLSEPAPAKTTAPSPARLHARFTLAPDKIVVTDGLFLNDAAGATIKGSIAGDKLDLHGVLVTPSLMEKQAAPCKSFHCPLGLSYRATGSRDAPSLFIEPFSDPLFMRDVLPP